jgi:hypothetical protein
MSRFRLNRTDFLTNAAVTAYSLIGNPLAFRASEKSGDCRDIAGASDPEWSALLKHSLQFFRKAAQHFGLNRAGENYIYGDATGCEFGR